MDQFRGRRSKDDFAVRVRNVSKQFGTGETAVQALDGIDVGFERGYFTSIMGSSGSGKSTLLHAMAGLDDVDQGKIFIEGTDVTRLDEDKLTVLRRDHIGFVFQAYNLLPTLNVLDNITLPFTLAGTKASQRWLSTVIDIVGLGDRLTHFPTQLSGGQQQRVAVARALATRPHIIFADEPTGNLDSQAGREILSYLRRAVDEAGQTVVMVTHDPVAASFSHRVVFLADGFIVDDMYEPTPRKVFDRLRDMGE